LISFATCETGIAASEALKKALRDVMTMCDHVKDTFEESENEYYAAGGTGH
jgi:DNA-directed RNA polymerase subunit L